MTSVKSAIKQTFSSSSNITETEKVKALQACTFDATSSDQVLTSDHGVKMSDTDNWYNFFQFIHRYSSSFSLFDDSRLRISDGSTVGPSLLEDQFAREKIHRFDHERIPERVVHARGSAAHGYFKVFDNRAAKYTHAPVLTDSSRTTPVFVRFSTVQGSRGSAVIISFFVNTLLTYSRIIFIRTLFAMFEGSQSSSTPTKVSGTSSETISLCFSFKMP